jgi:hypothetical protein
VSLCTQRGELLEGVAMLAPKARELAELALALLLEGTVLSLRSLQVHRELHHFRLVGGGLTQSFVSLAFQRFDTLLRPLQCKRKCRVTLHGRAAG